MSPSLPRLKCPLFVFWFALFFFPCARFPFSSKNFAPGCPRNDDSYLGRPTASPVFARPVGLVRSAVLRSPKGGAFRTQRRARPTTAGLRRPPWTRASPSLGESPLATGDSLAAPTSFWPSAELADWPRLPPHPAFWAAAEPADWPPSPPHSACGVPESPSPAARGLDTRWRCCRTVLRTPILSPELARNGDSATRAEKTGCRS